jgi:hypothetical protein
MASRVFNPAKTRATDMGRKLVAMTIWRARRRIQKQIWNMSESLFVFMIFKNLQQKSQDSRFGKNKMNQLQLFMNQ